MNNLQVLIIDDDKETANLFKTVLSLVGYDCEIILTAKAALARLSSNVPDLVLLDLRLGLEIGGEDILYQIRSNPRFSNTRVIVITAFPNIAEMVTNLADLILLKPVEIGQLTSLITRLGSFEVASKQIAFRDPITYLFDKEFFLTRLELAFERCRRRKDFLYGALVLELRPDGFDENQIDPQIWVNILREVADRLRSNLRPTDTIARLAGWKIAALAEELKHPDDMQVILKRIQQQLLQPYVIHGENYCLSIAFGAAIHRAEQLRPDELLELAEQALVESKASPVQTAFTIK